MPKFTPGPWRSSYDRGHFVETVHDDLESSGRVCTVDVEGVYSKEESAANAHLIAAAPDLLRALRMVVTRDTGNPDHDWTTCGEPSCIFARAAIAKAEGRADG